MGKFLAGISVAVLTTGTAYARPPDSYRHDERPVRQAPDPYRNLERPAMARTMERVAERTQYAGRPAESDARASAGRPMQAEARPSARASAPAPDPYGNLRAPAMARALEAAAARVQYGAMPSQFEPEAKGTPAGSQQAQGSARHGSASAPDPYGNLRQQSMARAVEAASARVQYGGMPNQFEADTKSAGAAAEGHAQSHGAGAPNPYRELEQGAVQRSVAHASAAANFEAAPSGASGAGDTAGRPAENAARSVSPAPSDVKPERLDRTQRDL